MHFTCAGRWPCCCGVSHARGTGGCPSCLLPAKMSGGRQATWKALGQRRHGTAARLPTWPASSGWKQIAQSCAPHTKLRMSRTASLQLNADGSRTLAGAGSASVPPRASRNEVGNWRRARRSGPAGKCEMSPPCASSGAQHSAWPASAHAMLEHCSAVMKPAQWGWNQRPQAVRPRAQGKPARM